jgi:dnd system-associated protein 4
MAMIYIDAKQKGLAEKLAKTQAKGLGRPIFSNYMQLMTFAAMIGNRCGSMSKVVSRDGEVESDVFDRNRMDGIVYLTSLHETGSGEILRDTKENEAACWKYFEEYAARGLEELENWMLDNPSDSDGVETILTEMKKVAMALVENEGADENLKDVTF